MGQIVRRKRKGRPPKPDLSRRSPFPPPDEVRTVRRSHRRRNVRYSSFIDYNDFIDDDDFELDRDDEEVLRDEDDEDVELRRGRKVKLVVKLSRRRGSSGGRAAESGDSGSEAGAAATDGDDEEAEEDSGSEGRVLKKRRISGRDEEDDYQDDNYQEDDYGSSRGEEEVRARWMNCLVDSSNWSSCSGETLAGGIEGFGFRF